MISTTILALGGIIGAILLLLKFGDGFIKWVDAWKEVRLRKINAGAIGLEAVQAHTEETKKLLVEVKSLRKELDEFREKQRQISEERWRGVLEANRAQMNEFEDRLFDRFETVVRLHANATQKF